MPRIDIVRRVACILAGIPCLAASVRMGYAVAFVERSYAWAALLLCIAFLAIGLGLVAAHFWARRLVAAVCLAVALLFPPGYINPFMASDTPNPPTVQSILGWMVPLVIGLLLCAWLLDPPREKASSNPPAAT